MAVTGTVAEFEVHDDHAAKPAVATGEWQPWADAVGALAAPPNASCKLSGLVAAADRLSGPVTEADRLPGWSPRRPGRLAAAADPPLRRRRSSATSGTCWTPTARTG
ncbi:hypothetical protein JCM4914_60050 [Streptomyces platensis subsp. malvinus]